jgi:hypothetical protein
VVGADLVVAVGQGEHGGQVADAPADVADDVQGGVVGPVEVLDEDDGGGQGIGELGEQGVEDFTDVLGGDRLGQGAAGAAGDVVQRAQGAAGEEVVAPADERPCVRARVGRPCLHQGRLADPRLAGHQHHRPATLAGGRHRSAQRRQLTNPLEQVRHGSGTV